MSYNTRIKLKSDTESNWLSQDPVLLDGEVAIVKCDGGITRKKIGDGSKKFSELAYDESKSLGLASAEVGQIPKVKAVDSNGVPTEWESVAMPSGGSSDMFYVLDMVDGEGDTCTINNDFDEAVSAIDQGKVFVYEGACLLATYSSSDGTANQITLGFDGFEGHIAILTWNRGNSSATIKQYLSPVIDPETITTTGVVYYDKTANSYSIKDMTPPTASASTAGTIKVGKGLSISDDGILSVTTATYYTGTSDPVDTLGADGDLYLKTEG